VGSSWSAGGKKESKGEVIKQRGEEAGMDAGERSKKEKE